MTASPVAGVDGRCIHGFHEGPSETCATALFTFAKDMPMGFGIGPLARSDFLPVRFTINGFLCTQFLSMASVIDTAGSIPFKAMSGAVTGRVDSISFS